MIRFDKVFAFAVLALGAVACASSEVPGATQRYDNVKVTTDSAGRTVVSKDDEIVAMPEAVETAPEATSSHAATSVAPEHFSLNIPCEKGGACCCQACSCDRNGCTCSGCSSC